VPRESLFWLPENQPGRKPEMRPKYQLEVQRNGLSRKVREYHVVSRMGDNHDLGVYNNSVSAVERAMVERYFLCEVDGEFLPALKTSRKAWDTAPLREFRRGCVEYVKPQATVLTQREVVECYTGAKRKLYENANRSLMRTPIHRRDAYLRPFTKFEKQSLSKAPRIINPRSPRYNIMLGSTLRRRRSFTSRVSTRCGVSTQHTQSSKD